MPRVPGTQNASYFASWKSMTSRYRVRKKSLHALPASTCHLCHPCTARWCRLSRAAKKQLQQHEAIDGGMDSMDGGYQIRGESQGSADRTPGGAFPSQCARMSRSRNGATAALPVCEANHGSIGGT